VDETGLGLTPKVIFGLANGLNAIDSNSSQTAMSFGWAVDNGVSYDNVCMFTSADTDDGIQNSRTRIVTDTDSQADYGMFVGSSGSSPIMAGEITDMASGQFTLRTNDIDAQAGNLNTDLYYLALDFDGEAEMFVDAVPQTDVDWVPLSGVSFTPESVLIMAAYSLPLNETRSTDDGNFWRGFYVADDSGEESMLSFCHEYNTATNSNRSSRYDTHYYTQPNTAGAPDFVAENPIFASGSITFDNAETLFSQATNGSSRALGIAFGAGSVDTAIYVPTGPIR
jgi:hypothetical protein